MLSLQGWWPHVALVVRSGSSLSQRFSHKKEQPLASVAPARVQTHYVIYLWNVAELVLLLFALEPFISPLLALVSVPSHGQVVALVGRLLTPPSVFILRCACCNPGRRWNIVRSGFTPHRGPLTIATQHSRSTVAQVTGPHTNTHTHTHTVYTPFQINTQIAIVGGKTSFICRFSIFFTL